ncbi:MAG: antibiotic biosynthesis monooxygenase [Deltaproteobacteria bacterium]|nr:antibiotic biosynthesis monooxygenase [Deltaproteobacteria bacterium]
MLQVLALIKAKPGKEGEMESALTAFVDKVAEEPGTLRYVVHKDLSDPTRFMVYESYADEDAFAAHSKSPHMAELFGKMAGLLDGEPSISMYEAVAEK